jgi:phage terminase small subunit
MKDYVQWINETVIFHDSDEIDSDKAACISEISQTTTERGGTFRIKLHDKKGALELLGKHLKLFVDEQKVDHTGKIEVIFNIPRPRKEGNEG